MVIDFLYTYAVAVDCFFFDAVILSSDSAVLTFSSLGGSTQGLHPEFHWYFFQECVLCRNFSSSLLRLLLILSFSQSRGNFIICEEVFHGWHQFREVPDIPL